MKKILFALTALWSVSVSAQYNSLLWKISGNGLKQPSYLFGTMHTSDARVSALGEKAMPYLSAVKTYAMELDPKEAMNMGLISKLMMGGDYSLKKMIPAEDYRFLDSTVKKQLGFSIAMFDNVAPIFTMTLFEASAMGLNENKSAGKGEVLDLYFHKHAKKQKKKILGIETVEEQLDALNALSFQEQADLLIDEVHHLQQNEKGGTDLVKYYLDQNLDSLAANDMDSKMPEKFYKALVTDRNEKMADRTSVFMKDQSVFIAVGALHLPGEAGVINLLRRKGFTVEPVR